MILAGAAAAKKYKKMPYADRRKNKTAQRQRGNCTFQKAFEDSGADRKDQKKVRLSTRLFWMKLPHTFAQA